MNTSTISIPQSYTQAFQIYKTHFVRLMSVALLTHVFTYILLFSLGVATLSSIFTISSVKELFSFTNPYMYITVLLLILMACIQLLGFIALTYMSVHYKETTVLGAFQHALEYMFRFILLALSIVGISIVGLIIGYIIVTMLSIVLWWFSPQALDSGFGWLTIIPVITSAVASTLFIFSTFILVESKKTVRQALSESLSLTRTYFWHIVQRILLLYFLLTFINISFSLIPKVGNFLFLVLITPFSVVYLYSFYRHLKTIQTTA